MASNVTFRRIGGRVVPIKQGGSRKNDDAKKATARIGTGLVTAVGSGVAAGALDLYASREKLKSLNLSHQKEFRYHNPQFKIAAHHRLESIRAHKAAARFKTAGAAIGATLIGSGVHKALDSTKLDEPTKATVSSASGIGAYFAVRAAHTKVFGHTKVWAAMKEAAKRVAIRGFKL